VREAPPDEFREKTQNGIVYRGFIDRGLFWLDKDGKRKPFVRSDGTTYIGLLNGKGQPLQHGEPEHVLWFAIKKNGGAT